MQERDPVPTGSRARRAVDQGYALGMESREVALEVTGSVRDVVQSLTLTLEESTDGGVGTERLEQFHGADEGDADTLSLEGLWRGAGVTREQFEEAAALFDGVHGDGDVIEWTSRREGWGHGPDGMSGSKQRQGEGDGDE
jgi:hypothetical protein